MIEEKLMNILATRKYTGILSTKTNKPYMTEDGKCYLFESMGDAKAFSEKNKDTVPEGKPDYIKPAPFLTKSYAMGIDMIRLKTGAGDEFLSIPLTEEDVHKQHFNREADRDILLYKETIKAKYIKDLYTRQFLAPAIIEERKAGKYPVLHYATAALGNGITAQILFTTLYGFDTWNKNNGERFLPNQTTLDEYASIRSGRPVIINPESDMLYIDQKTIDIIKGATCSKK